jgi:hypothetical protein
VVVYYNIQEVPQGTTTLQLFFVTNQEWPQGSADWNQGGEYSFETHVWSGHRSVLGKPAGRNVEIRTILRALSSSSDSLGEIQGSFTLDQVR